MRKAKRVLGLHANLEEGSCVQKSHERGLGVHWAGRYFRPDIRTTELLVTPPFGHQNLGTGRGLVADGAFASDSSHHGRRGTDGVESTGRGHLFLFTGK